MNRCDKNKKTDDHNNLSTQKKRQKDKNIKKNKTTKNK